MKDLEKIKYISLPSSIVSDDSSIKRDIPVPIRVPEGKSDITEEDISLAAIVSAMIEVVTWDESSENAEYYKYFITAADPDIVKKLNSAAVAKRDQRDYEFSEELFLAVYHLFPQDASCINAATNYSFMAREEEKKNDLKKADFYLKKAKEILLSGLEKLGENENILYEIASFEGYLGNFSSSLSYIERFLKVAQDSKKRETMEEMKKKIMIQSQNDEEIKEAYDFLFLGENKKAIDKMNSFIGRNDNIWNAYFLRGWAYRKEGMYDKAREDLLKCVSLGESSSELYNELSLCELGSGNIDLAITYLESAEDLDKTNLTVTSNLISLYLKKRLYEKARPLLEKALHLAEDDRIITALKNAFEKETGEKVEKQFEKIRDAEKKIQHRHHHEDGKVCQHSHSEE